MKDPSAVKAALQWTVVSIFECCFHALHAGVNKSVGETMMTKMTAKH